jgi:hypothetical protein
MICHTLHSLASSAQRAAFVALALFGPTLLACEDFALEASKATDGAADTAGGGDADNGADSGKPEDGPTYEAAWYSVEGSASVADGTAALEGFELRFALADVDLVRLDCDFLSLSDLAVSETPPEGMYAWWTFTVPANPGCEAENLQLPESLGVGLGPLDPEVRARLGTVDKDGVADELWGAWFSANNEDPVAFGYAEGTLGGPADVAPPDDSYALVPLLLQPVPASE